MCYKCHGTGLGPLPFKDIAEKLGDLNWMLKDYGVSIRVTVDNEGNVQMKEGKMDINVGPPLEWMDEQHRIIWSPGGN